MNTWCQVTFPTTACKADLCKLRVQLKWTKIRGTRTCRAEACDHLPKCRRVELPPSWCTATPEAKRPTENAKLHEYGESTNASSKKKKMLRKYDGRANKTRQSTTNSSEEKQNTEKKPETHKITARKIGKRIFTTSCLPRTKTVAGISGKRSQGRVPGDSQRNLGSAGRRRRGERERGRREGAWRHWRCAGKALGGGSGEEEEGERDLWEALDQSWRSSVESNREKQSEDPGHASGSIFCCSRHL